MQTVFFLRIQLSLVIPRNVTKYCKTLIGKQSSYRSLKNTSECGVSQLKTIKEQDDLAMRSAGDLWVRLSAASKQLAQHFSHSPQRARLWRPHERTRSLWHALIQRTQSYNPAINNMPHLEHCLRTHVPRSLWVGIS